MLAAIDPMEVGDLGDFNRFVKKRKLSHDGSDFKPGNIIKVEVKNFTTYTHGIYNLSSNLNMIIGPNGTGKSTLVSAICLGLGGKLDLIKRKSLKDMIKSGCTQASLKVTLMDDNGGHITISRTFTEKESVWKLDNHQVKELQIKQTVKRLNIQLDNLCHFLPQERVAEFASLSPEKLLLETERTLGNGELAVQHDRLISLDVDNIKLMEHILQMETSLAELLQQKEELESEAKKYHQYQTKVDQVNKHEKLIPYAQLLDLKNKTSHLKEARNQAKLKIKHFHLQLIPVQNQIDELKSKAAASAREFDQVDQQLRTKVASTKQLNHDFPQFTEVITQLQSRIDLLKQKSASKKQELDALIVDQNKLLAKKENIELPDDDEIKHLTELRSAKYPELDKINQAITDNKLEIESERRKLNEIYENKQRIEQRLTSTDKLSSLELNNRDQARINSLKGHKLLRNKPEFAGKYFECPVVTCVNKDRRYAKFIEKSIDNSTLLSITVVDDEASRNIRQYLKSQGLNVPLRKTTVKSLPRQPCSSEELKSYGFDGYLSDFIEAPKEVLSMLYDIAKIHLTPVSLGELTESQVSRLTSPQQNGGMTFAKFMAKDTLYTVQRSAYGQRKIFYSTVRIYDSRYFTHSGISPQVRESLENELHKLGQQENEIKQLIAKLNDQIKDLRVSKEELDRELDGYKTRREELVRRKKEFTSIVTQLENMTQRIQKLETDSRKDYTEKIKETQNKILEKYADNATKMQKIASETSEVTKLTFKLKIFEFQKLQAKNREVYGIKLHEELAERGKSLEQEYLRLKEQYDEIKKGDAAKKIAEQSLSYTDEEKAELSAMAKQYMDEGVFTESSLRSKIALLEQERATLATADKNSIDNLQQKLHDIEYFEKALPGLKSKKEQKDREINDIRMQWEPKLKELVRKISIAFSSRFTKVASDGQVELVTNDRYKDWRLHILVKFRQDSEFKVLDSQSQSGGERAVSTIFFVMSLQGLTEAPFRVVDEINQGMDNKNERMAHKYLVHSASRKGSSQYFLVTPKLLTGLYYSSEMKVHCIYTGPHLDISANNMESLNFVGVNG